jgi:hypothetical protein
MVLGLLGNILKPLMGGFTPRGGGSGRPFRATLNNADFTGIATANQTLVANQWTQIGYYKVPAQTGARVGYGNPKEPDNQGYIYFRIDDTSGNQITDGSMRLVHSNAEGTRRDVVFQESLTRLSGSQTDRTQMVPVPEVLDFPILGEDSRIVIEVNTATAHTIDYDGTNTIIRIPVTRYL